MVGDFLYATTTRDQQVTPLQPVFIFQQDQGLFVARSIAFFVPQGFALHVANVWCEAQPAGPQIVTNVDITVRALLPQTAGFPTNAIAQIASFNEQPTPSAAGQLRAIRSEARLIIDSRHHVLVCSATYNAGASNNTIRASVAGYLIPVGNLAPGQMSAALA